MSLDLPADQPAETMPAAPGERDAMPPIVATVVTTDGVIVRLSERPDGSIALLPSGNRAPLLFDRFQANAIREALGVEV